MKKIDEMDRNIQLRSEEYGYKATLLVLCAWTFFNIYQSCINNTKLDIVPSLLLCLALCIQGVSQIAMKRKMILGDEEYKESNKIAEAVIIAITVIAIILSIGLFFFYKV